MRFALTDGAFVRDVRSSVNEQPPFAVIPPLQWVCCDDTVTTWHTYDGQKFSLEKHLDAAWEGLRRIRDDALSACDWTQVGDAQLTPELRAKWAAYRQALRDLPSTSDDPYSVTWPFKPENSND